MLFIFNGYFWCCYLGCYSSVYLTHSRNHPIHLFSQTTLLRFNKRFFVLLWFCFLFEWRRFNTIKLVYVLAHNGFRLAYKLHIALGTFFLCTPGLSRILLFFLLISSLLYFFVLCRSVYLTFYAQCVVDFPICVVFSLFLSFILSFVLFV